MEYWIDYGVGDGRDGQKTHRGICGMKMPIKYVAEMYVDRVSASKNYQRDKTNCSLSFDINTFV